MIFEIMIRLLLFTRGNEKAARRIPLQAARRFIMSLRFQNKNVLLWKNTNTFANRNIEIRKFIKTLGGKLTSESRSLVS